MSTNKRGHNGQVPKIDAPTLAEHHSQRRSAILSAATDLLLTDGAAAVTPAAVAAGSGLARSSVYQYYSSTGALLGAAVEEMFARAQAAIDAALAGAETPEQRLAAYLDASLDLAREGHGQLAGLGSSGLPVPPECAQRVVALHEQLVAPLTAALADAGDAHPALTAGLLNGVVGAAAAQLARGAADDVVRAGMHRFARAALAPA